MHWLAGVLFSFAFWVQSDSAVAAPPDPLVGLVSSDGHASVGLLLRSEESPYRGVGARFDLMPLYLYENRNVYFYSYRAGLKLLATASHHVDLFVAQRFEGFPSQSIPESLAGMAVREQGVDAGLGYRQRFDALEAFVEGRIDVSGVSEGSEMRLGLRQHIDGERLSLLPYATASFRNAALNDHYYGVRPSEARPGRPEYQAGGGMDVSIGLDVRYRLSEGWRLLGGVGLTHLSDEIRSSPIVGRATLLSGYVGAVYDFGPPTTEWTERDPVIVRVLYGRSTDCNLITTMTLRCVSVATQDRTGIAGVQFGKPFIENANGWPLDFVGFVGVLRHFERGLQDDGYDVQAYMKAQYHGFPWSEWVRTRIGFGAGLSLASQVPYVEGRDQARRGRSTSRLLNYLEPTIDVNVGDIVRWKALTETYAGFGVSHRSGIFGQSRALGNVNGGSNYIYFYVESLLVL